MKTSFVAVVLALFLMAGGIFAFKVRWMNYPLLPPPEAPLWVVKAEIGFDTAAAPVALRLAVPPKEQPGLRVTDQVTLVQGYSAEERISPSGNRLIVWSGRDSVPQRRQLIYRAMVSPGAEAMPPPTVPPALPIRLTGPPGEAADRLVVELREDATDELSQARQMFENVPGEWPDNGDLQ
jgi:hypothetical protein